MDDQHRVWAEMERETYLFHYWNKVTVTLRPQPGSLMYKARQRDVMRCCRSDGRFERG